MAQASSDEIAALSSGTSTSDTTTQEVSQPGQARVVVSNQANDSQASQDVTQPASDTQPQNDTPAVTDANTDNTDEKAKDLPPKTEVTLTLKGTGEYNSFPFTKETDKFYFMASVKASYFKETDRAPIDLCCVVDESSSMSGTRIELVKETVSFVLRNLTNKDRFGIIGYGSSAHTRLPLTKMDETGKKRADLIVKNIHAEGMTALCEGLEFGIKMMRDRNKEESNQIASIMMFTDGQANVGVTSAAGIQKHIEKTGDTDASSHAPKLGFVQQAAATNVAAPTNVAASNDKTTDDKDKSGKDDEKSKDETSKTDEGFVDMSLPCTINTFGFGANHNETLLEALSEWGRGMYTFIENTDTIAETFAECLGGLVSIVGRDLKVRVAALNGVEMVRCVSQGGYKVEETKSKQEYVITIPDIQSEENRDLVFEVSLPKLDEQRDAWPMAQISCQYQNVPKNRKDILSAIATINRCNETDEIGERNDELDAQCNRLLASEAMDVADKMAEKGDLTNARKVLSEAKVKIEQSHTFVQQKKGYYKYAQNLASDLDDVTKDLTNRQSYRSQGGKKLKMSKKAHAMQRSCHSTAYSSQRAYTNSSKDAMMSKFSRK